MPVAEHMERIRRHLAHGSKIVKRREHGGEIIVTVVKGFDCCDPERPRVLQKDECFPASEELRAFLDSDEIKAACYRPVQRGVILADIVGYSKVGTLAQLGMLTTFSRALREHIEGLSLLMPFNPILSFVPTGDGCYIITHEDIIDRYHRIALALFRMFELEQNFILKECGQDPEVGQRLQLRVACAVGECDFFTDISGRTNVFGVAINEAGRILNHGQSMAEYMFPDDETAGSVFFSRAAFDLAREDMAFLQAAEGSDLVVEDLGQVLVKHGQTVHMLWAKNPATAPILPLYTRQEAEEKGWSD